MQQSEILANIVTVCMDDSDADIVDTMTVVSVRLPSGLNWIFGRHFVSLDVLALVIVISVRLSQGVILYGGIGGRLNFNKRTWCDSLICKFSAQFLYGAFAQA